jgi:hypothetical protein
LTAQKITTNLMGKEVSTMYIRKTKSTIYVPFLFKPSCKVEHALIDSGASHNFMDPKSAKQLRVKLTKMEEPVKVLNVDGSKNMARTIDTYVTILVKIGNDLRQLRFYLAELRTDRIIFSYPFLRTFNPMINWRTGKIRQGKGIMLLQKQKRVTMVKRLQLTALRQCGVPPPGYTIYMRRTSFAQQWMAATKKSCDHLTEVTLPPKYQHHEHVFDQNLAAHSPPS